MVVAAQRARCEFDELRKKIEDERQLFTKERTGFAADHQ